MLEDKRIVDCDLPADFVVHRVDVCLVKGHTLMSQRRGVVNGDFVEFWVLTPILVYN